MIEAAAGGGYGVDGTALRAFAQTANTAEQSVDLLARQVHAALALGVQGGLDIGSAIARAEGGWSARLSQLAGQAGNVASLLTANAASYEQAETDILNALTRQAA
jgi:hypothetical protein